MTLKRKNIMTLMTIILTISLAALLVSPAIVSAADNDDKDKDKDKDKDSKKNNKGQNHIVNMKATALPNGQLAYQMMSHVIDSKDVTVQRYGANPTPSIPGPVIIMN